MSHHLWEYAKAPCKDCRDRQECCHKTCSEYYLFKMDLKRIAEEKERVRKSTPEICRTVVKQIWKELKGR